MADYGDDRAPRRGDSDCDVEGAGGEAPESPLAIPEFAGIESVSLDAFDVEGQALSLSAAIYGLSLRVRVILTAVFVGVALVSIVGLSPVFSNPDTYAGITRTLDEKKGNVLALTAAATSAATAISFLPDDAGSAIADKLTDLSLGFVVILTAIFLEKYLLTIIGFIVFTFVFPLCCVLFIATLYLGRFRQNRRTCEIMWKKLLVMGVAFLLLVPVSVGLSNMIDATYADSINQAIEQAEQSTQQVESAVEVQERQESAQPDPTNEGEQTFFDQVGEWWGNVTNAAGDVVNSVTGAVTGAFAGVTAWFQNVLSNFIEVIAVMLVTSCVIPILVLIIFLYIIKAIFNVDVSKPIAMLSPRRLRASVAKSPEASGAKAVAKRSRK